MTKFGMTGLFLMALAGTAAAQQPSPEDVTEALQLKLRVTQDNLDQAYLWDWAAESRARRGRGGQEIHTR